MAYPAIQWLFGKSLGGSMCDGRITGMEGEYFYICYLGQGCILAFAL